MSFLFSIIFSLNIFSFETERVRIFSNGNYHEVEAVKGEVIVRIPNNKKNEIIEKLKTLGYEEIKQLYRDFYLAKNKTSKVSLSLLSNSDIEFSPNVFLKKFYFPADPYISKQWYLNKINIFNAWDFEEVKDTITVVVVDEGIDYQHDDLKNVVTDTNTWICSSGGSVIEHCSEKSGEHGTEVSGIISAQRNNSIGIAGISKIGRAHV